MCYDAYREHQRDLELTIEEIVKRRMHPDDMDEDEDSPWVRGVFHDFQKVEARTFAMDSIKFLNNLDGGKRYELVQPGAFSGRPIARGLLSHINFKAKEKDCPGAKVETLFSQVRYVDEYHVCDCCVSLGPSEEVPHWRDADTRGCKFCLGKVQHPAERCEKLIMRSTREQVCWLYPDFNTDDGDDSSSDDYDSNSDSDFLSD